MTRLLPPLLALACSPYRGIEDRWSPTWELCATDGAVDPLDPDATLSAACQDRLLADFQADGAALAAAPVDAGRPDLRACFLVSAHTLLRQEAGSLPLTEASAHIYPVFLDALQEVRWQVGGDGNRQLAYNFAAHLTWGVQPTDGLQDGLLARTDDDGLHLSPQIAGYCGLGLASLLFHEAGHRVAEDHVPCPDDPTLSCDQDAQGTYALEVSLDELWLEQMAEGDAGYETALELRDTGEALMLGG